MIKKILLLLTVFTSGCYAQWTNDKGTRDSSWYVGPQKNITMVLDKTLKDSLKSGSFVAWDTTAKAFQPSTAFKLDSAGMSIKFDSSAGISFYNPRKKQWDWWTADSVFTLSEQNKDGLLYQAGQINELFSLTDTNEVLISRYSTLRVVSDSVTMESIARVNADTVLSGRITTQAGEIDLRVKKLDYNGETILSYINLLPETAKISAKNIEFEGRAIFKAMSGGADSTVIDGGLLKTGTVYADFIRADTIINKVFLGVSIKTNSGEDAAWVNGELSGNTFTSRDSDEYGFYVGEYNSMGFGATLKNYSNDLLLEAYHSYSNMGFGEYVDGVLYNGVSITPDGISKTKNGVTKNASFEGHTHSNISGSFTTNDGSTVTVTNGIITNIQP